MCLLFWFAFASLLANAQSSDNSPDDLDGFALALLNNVQILSFRNDVEYCGLLGYDSSGNFTATPPRPGSRFECTPKDEAPVVEVLASYHTHAGYHQDADSEAPSVRDLKADFDEGIEGYIGTPGGRVWLNLVDERISVLLCGPDCVAQAPGFKECPAFMPAQEYTIEELEERGDRDDGTC